MQCCSIGVTYSSLLTIVFPTHYYILLYTNTRTMLIKRFCNNQYNTRTHGLKFIISNNIVQQLKFLPYMSSRIRNQCSIMQSMTSFTQSNTLLGINRCRVQSAIIYKPGSDNQNDLSSVQLINLTQWLECSVVLVSRIRYSYQSSSSLFTIVFYTQIQESCYSKDFTITSIVHCVTDHSVTDPTLDFMLDYC